MMAILFACTVNIEDNKLNSKEASNSTMNRPEFVDVKVTGKVCEK
jgi:hypothetical protein